MVVYERVYNKLYIFRALKESESNVYQCLGVDYVTLSILWKVNSEKGMMEEEFGGCLVMVDVNDCGGVGGGR